MRAPLAQLESGAAVAAAAGYCGRQAGGHEGRACARVAAARLARILGAGLEPDLVRKDLSPVNISMPRETVPPREMVPAPPRTVVPAALPMLTVPAFLAGLATVAAFLAGGAGFLGAALSTLVTYFWSAACTANDACRLPLERCCCTAVPLSAVPKVVSCGRGGAHCRGF